jgi:hypothetical protein
MSNNDLVLLIISFQQKLESLIVAFIFLLLVFAKWVILK